MFIYSDDVVKEAECVVNTLVPYIQHFPPEANSYPKSLFGEDAIEHCGSLVYDPTQNEVIDTDVTDAVEERACQYYEENVE